jgi:hypothetical protein
MSPRVLYYFYSFVASAGQNITKWGYVCCVHLYCRMLLKFVEYVHTAECYTTLSFRVYVHFNFLGYTFTAECQITLSLLRTSSLQNVTSL